MVQRYTNPFGSQGSYADELRKKRERDQRELVKRLIAQQNYRQSLQRVQDIETIAENQNKNIEQLTNVPTVESYSPTRKVEIKHVTKQKSSYSTISYEFPKSKGDPYYPINNKKQIIQ